MASGGEQAVGGLIPILDRREAKRLLETSRIEEVNPPRTRRAPRWGRGAALEVFDVQIGPKGL